MFTKILIEYLVKISVKQFVDLKYWFKQNFNCNTNLNNALP